MSLRRPGVGLVAVWLAVGLGACGAGDGSSVVARVGDKPITKKTLDRWTRVVRSGEAFTGLRGAPRHGTARQRALTLLITSDWLFGEAKREHLTVSPQAVREALTERARGEGETAFRRRLASMGQKRADLELELRAELAFNAIVQELVGRAEEITMSEVVDFYRANPTLFRTPESRVVDIVTGLRSEAAATSLAKRLGAGHRFARAAYRKLITKTPGVFTGSADKKALDHAIFSARTSVMSHPMRFGEGWTVFVVRRVLSPKSESFDQARTEALERLKLSRQRHLKVRLSREFAGYWLTRTSCESGYVAPGCPQYRGALGAYEDPFSDRDQPQ